jgi:hypothetical protein
MHQAGIATIRAYMDHCKQPGMTAARVANGIKSLEGLTFPPEKWQEYAVPAANAQCETLEAMRKLQTELQAREDEAARLEAQRVEQARVQAELDRQRAELARQAAELAAQRAESERLERLAYAHRATVSDDLRQVALSGFAQVVDGPKPAALDWTDEDPDAAASQPAQPAPETVDPDLTLAADIVGPRPVFDGSGAFGVVAIDAAQSVAAPAESDEDRAFRRMLTLCREALEMLGDEGNLCHFTDAHALALRQAVDAFAVQGQRVEVRA